MYGEHGARAKLINAVERRAQERCRGDCGKPKTKSKRELLRSGERVITENINILTNKKSNLNNGRADIVQKEKIKKEPPRESGVFRKRIGSTNYSVSVHFSKTSKETIDDKILRLIKNEAASGKTAGE
jgi:hypothetical protein